MSTKPIILVFGATGAQGGSVVNYLLEDGKFQIRAVSRNVNSENAQALVKRGVEVVAGDFSSGIPDSAFSGVTGVFLNINFWDPSSMHKEYEQSVPIVDAALKAGVTHFVYSSLANSEAESNGKFKVAHFTTKAKVEAYIKGKSFKYTAFPAPAFYFQNYRGFFPAKADSDGNLSVTMPLSTKPIDGIDITQFGGVVTAIFNYPEKYNGKFIAVAGETISPQACIDAISERIGKPIKLNLIPLETFATFPFPGAEELAEMFGWFNEYGYYGKHSDVEEGKRIDPTLRNFKEFLVHSNFKYDL
jgi:uncharacterized protein YbjT (DUF2867 family)